MPLQTAKPPVSPLSLKWISVIQYFVVLVFCPGMAENLLLHSLVKTCFVVQALWSSLLRTTEVCSIPSSAQAI